MSIETLKQTRIAETLEDRRLFSDSDRVSEAIGSLRQEDEYEVFVKAWKGLSFATVRDLLRVSNPTTTRLGSVAYPAPFIGQEEDLGKAAAMLFQYRLRAVPSYVDGNRVKVVTARSIVDRIATVGPAKTHAADIMTQDPVTIQGDDSASKAKQIMLRRSFDHLPVIENEHLNGVLTSSQLLFGLLPEERAPSGFYGPMSRVRFDFPVSRIYTKSVVETEPGANLKDVIAAIRKSGSTYALVTFGGNLMGIITFRDIVNLLVTRDRHGPPFYIVGLPEEPYESERAKLKFERLAAYLAKAIPSIQETRAIIKKKTGSDKTRYEVSINVYAPNKSWAYTESGYGIAEVFDALGPKIKRLLGSKQSKVTEKHGDTLRKSGPLRT